MRTTSESPVRPDGGRDALAAESGEQVILVTESMTSPLGHLPDRAFGNLLLLSVRSPDRIERAIEDRGLNPASVGVIPISGSPVEYEGPLWVADAVSPNDLTGISIAFSHGMQHVADGTGWVTVDNLGTLLMYAAEDRLYRLVSHLVSQCRERNVRSVYTVAGESMGEQTFARFRGVCDRVEDRS